MKSSYALPVLCISNLALIVACGGQSGGDPAGSGLAPSVRDSAGVEIVEVPGAMLDGLPEWRFTDPPTLTIGAASGEAPYLFARITAARRLNNGEIVVVDGDSRELRVFGVDGRFLRKYGGRGQGPGEFSAFPLTVSESDGTSVSIYDGSLHRITTINLVTGKFVQTDIPTQCKETQAAPTTSCNPAWLLTDGTIFAGLTTSSGRPPARDGRLTVRPGLVTRSGPRGEEILRVVDSITGPASFTKGFGEDYFGGPVLYDPAGKVAWSGTEVVYGDPLRFEIRIRRQDGRLRQVVRVMKEPRVSTAEMLNAVRHYADSAHKNPAVMEYLSTVDPGAPVPSFGQLRVDRTGRIWIRDYDPPEWMGPRKAGIWTILGTNGVPLARVAATRNTSMMELGEDYALVLARDSLGVEYVRLFGLAK